MYACMYLYVCMCYRVRIPQYIHLKFGASRENPSLSRCLHLPISALDIRFAVVEEDYFSTPRRLKIVTYVCLVHPALSPYAHTHSHVSTMTTSSICGSQLLVDPSL